MKISTKRVDPKEFSEEPFRTIQTMEKKFFSLRHNEMRFLLSILIKT